MMDKSIKRYFIGAASSFFGMVGVCLVIHPSILRNYQYGVSQFGAIGSTQIPFFIGFAMTAYFLSRIADSVRAAGKFLSTIFLMAAFCLICIAITSYPINRFTYDLHWVFVIALILDVVTAAMWHIRKANSVNSTDYILGFVFIGTVVISILPLIHHIPFFRNFVLREVIIFGSSFWLMSRATTDLHNKIQRV